MAEEHAERRLAAILAAGVAGYGQSTGLDEEGAHVQLKGHLRTLVDPKIAEHRGRMVKSTADAMLAEFGSVVDAVRCAVEIQRGMAQRNSTLPQNRRIEFRIGINVGDIMIDGDDIFGDGVNVAARLEGLAQAGGICVSSRVQEDARGKLDATFEDAGEHQLKNIERPVRVYRVRLGGAAVTTRPALSLPNKPSIAVLPFENMSGDAEQDYFADGIVEDIITALSHFRELFVIARNSTFTYKGRAIDVKEVGRELGVRYVLEGSVRKAANRVRITGQLIDAGTGAHLWADRFQGAIEDIFDLQDQVATSVVNAVAPKMEQAEIERAKRKPTESLDAYDNYLRGLASFYQDVFDREANGEALRLFSQAIELDPGFATAYGMAACCYVWRKANGWMTDLAHEIAEGERLARRAVALGKDDAVALARGGLALAFVAGELDAGVAAIDRALALNPNLTAAWYASGWVRDYLGDPDMAIEHLARAMRSSPLDPEISRMQSGTAFAHFVCGRYDEALAWTQKALGEQPNYVTAIRIAAATKALQGRLEEARQAMARLRALDPALRVSNLKDRIPLRRHEDMARFAEGLRKAGLPE